MNGIKYDTIQIEKPNNPYIILEILSRDKNVCRGIQIINAKDKGTIKIVNIFLNLKGRGSDTDMRITDISVSRYHAFITY